MTLPIAPSTIRPETFSTEMDSFLGALPDFETEMNSIGAVVSAASGISIPASTIPANQVWASPPAVAGAPSFQPLKTLNGVSLLGAGNVTVEAFAIGDVVTTARELASPTYLPCDGAVYLKSSYAALFSEVGTLPDGSASLFGASRTLPSALGSFVAGIASGNGFAVILTFRGVAHKTVDGINFTSTTLAFDRQLINPAFGGGNFIAIEKLQNLSFTSSDGVTWVQRTLPTLLAGRFWSGITYGNGEFLLVAAGNNSTVTSVTYKSSNGVNWTQVGVIDASTFMQAFRVVYGNGIYLVFSLGSTDSTCFTSTDGVTWVKRTISGFTALDNPIFLNGKFYFTSNSSSASFVSSSDGVTWATGTFPATAFWKSITYLNGIYFAVANGASAARSADGVTWTSFTMPASSLWTVAGTISDSFIFCTSATTGGTVAAAIYQANYDVATQFITPKITPVPAGLNYYIKAQ